MSLPVRLYQTTYCTECYASCQVYKVQYNTPFSQTESFSCVTCGPQEGGGWSTRSEVDWIVLDIEPPGSDFFKGPFLAVRRNAPKGQVDEITLAQQTWTDIETLGAAVMLAPKEWRVWPTRHRVMAPYYRINHGQVYWLAASMKATVLHGMWRHARKRCR